MSLQAFQSRSVDPIVEGVDGAHPFSGGPLLRERSVALGVVLAAAATVAVVVLVDVVVLLLSWAPAA